MKANVQIKTYLHDIDKRICYKINFQFLIQYLGKSQVPVPELVRDASLGGEHTSLIEREVFLNISNSQHSLSALRGSASLWEKCNICLLFFDFLYAWFYESERDF